MLDFLFKKKANAILAPVDGKAHPITDVDDPVFKDKILGDGVAIVPSTNVIYAPCDGTIFQVANTKHAICIRTNDGLDLLIHVGLDTVKLKGEGFECHIEQDQKVNCGDKLLTFDREFIEKKGCKLITPCIITNFDVVKEHEFLTGEVVHAETKIIEYKL